MEVELGLAGGQRLGRMKAEHEATGQGLWAGYRAEEVAETQQVGVEARSEPQGTPASEQRPCPRLSGVGVVSTPLALWGRLLWAEPCPRPLRVGQVMENTRDPRLSNGHPGRHSNCLPPACACHS